MLGLHTGTTWLGFRKDNWFCLFKKKTLKHLFFLQIVQTKIPSGFMLTNVEVLTRIVASWRKQIFEYCLEL